MALSTTLSEKYFDILKFKIRSICGLTKFHFGVTHYRSSSMPNIFRVFLTFYFYLFTYFFNLTFYFVLDSIIYSVLLFRRSLSHFFHKKNLIKIKYLLWILIIMLHFTFGKRKFGGILESSKILWPQRSFMSHDIFFLFWENTFRF